MGFAAGLCLLLSVSLTAHAATQTHPAIPVLADWIHLTGMCFWLGGLPFLFTGVRALRRAAGRLELPRRTSAIAERFSTMALFSVAAIGVTGLYAAYLRVGSLQALYTSIYGQALLLKQVFVLLLLLLAAVNLLWILPRLRRAAARRRTGCWALWSISPRMVLLGDHPGLPAAAEREPADLPAAGKDRGAIV